MTTSSSLPTCWIIDHSQVAAETLRDLLQTGEYGEVIGTSATVGDWPGSPVDCLFIRITAWDDYLEWRALRRAPDPGTVIFLSGQHENLPNTWAKTSTFTSNPHSEQAGSPGSCGAEPTPVSNVGH